MGSGFIRDASMVYTGLNEKQGVSKRAWGKFFLLMLFGAGAIVLVRLTPAKAYFSAQGVNQQRGRFGPPDETAGMLTLPPI